jgi:hypothetical protein
MEKLTEICKAGDGLLLAISYMVVDVTDTLSVEKATQWWEEDDRARGRKHGRQAAGFHRARTP